jgi:hypothetical protein
MGAVMDQERIMQMVDKINAEMTGMRVDEVMSVIASLIATVQDNLPPNLDKDVWLAYMLNTINSIRSVQ